MSAASLGGCLASAKLIPVRCRTRYRSRLGREGGGEWPPEVRAAMQDPIGEACKTGQAAAAGQDEAAIRRMLTAELRSREVDLPPGLLNVIVEQIAAGNYTPGVPILSVRRPGLINVPFIGPSIGHLFRPALQEHARRISPELFEDDGVGVTEHDVRSARFRMYPRPPDRDLYAPTPEEVPPPARLIPDADLRERMPELFEDPPLAPGPPGSEPPTMYAVSVWLEDSGGMVAVCDRPGRLGILDAEDAEAYLPLVRSAHAQDKVVAAQAEFLPTAGGWMPTIVRAVPRPSDPGPPLG
jgi:hypothetical protein